MKYKVKSDFDYDPAGRADNPQPTTFHKDEIYEFEPYTGKCCRPGEMVLKTHILPENNNGWVWKPEYIDEHFEILED